MKLIECYEIKGKTRYYNFQQCIYFLNAMGRKKYGDSFRLQKEDQEILYKLLVYAIKDEDRCKEYGLDIQKGLLLIGPIGCGKTSLMELLKQFLPQQLHYPILSTRSIASEFNKEGFPVIQQYSNREKVICLDDLGVESNMKHFGNECNTIGEILLNRYDLMMRTGIVTHATTNLNAHELESLYGNRVRSRLRSMFNLIPFGSDAKDKRG